MSNSNSKKHKEKIVDNKATIYDPMNSQLELIERALNAKHPPIIRCVLATCEHITECWDVGAKWKGDILGCKSPSKLEETYHENEYISYPKPSKLLRFNKQEIGIMIKGVRNLFKYLPMHRVALEELIKKLEDLEEFYGIG